MDSDASEEAPVRPALEKKKKRTGVRPKSLSFDEAVARHPYVDRLRYRGVVRGSHVGRDHDGKLLFVFMKDAIPASVRAAASTVLRKAPRAAEMRAAINGGKAPLSAITGYYDYTGTPLPLKCRKTAFTHDAMDEWQAVFPFIEYCNETYRRVLPSHWGRQNKAIPDPVRIRGSVFSTCTVNNKFRTAVHTDNGDFDDGFGVVTVLEGNWEGVMLGFPASGLCVDIRPGDVLLFNTHCLHGNTELEGVPGAAGAPLKLDYDRLSVVLYYRYQLGEEKCLATMQQRKEGTDLNPAVPPPDPAVHDNGVNLNQTHAYTPKAMTLYDFLQGWTEGYGGGAEATARRLSEHHEILSLYFDLKNHGSESKRERNEREAGYTAPRETRDIASKLTGPADSGKHLSFPDTLFKKCEENVTAVATDELCEYPKLVVLLGKGLADEWLHHTESFVEDMSDAYAQACKTRSRGQAELRLAIKVRLPADGGGDPPAAAAPPAGYEALRRSFAGLGEAGIAAFEAMNGLSSFTEAPRHHRMSYWLGVAAHIIRKARHIYDVPLSYVSVAALYRWLMEYDEAVEKGNGAERATLELSVHAAAPLLSLRSQLQALRKGGRNRYVAPSVLPWIANDAYDYQTEDAAVDYAGLDVPPPHEDRAFPPHVRRVRSQKKKASSADAAAAMYREILGPVGGEDTEAAPLRVLLWTHAVAHVHGGGALAPGAAPAAACLSGLDDSGLARSFRRQFAAYCTDEHEVAEQALYGGPAAAAGGGGDPAAKRRKGEAGEAVPPPAPPLVLRRRGVEFTCAAPSEAKGAGTERFDVVCVVGMAECVSEAVLAEELAAARDAVHDGGVLLVKVYSGRPVDHARLRSDALARRTQALRALRAFMGAQRAAPVQQHWVADDLAAWIGREAPAWTCLSGVYQVENSCMQECFLAFLPAPRHDSA